jgi:hypothetical protein
MWKRDILLGNDRTLNRGNRPVKDGSFVDAYDELLKAMKNLVILEM